MSRGYGALNEKEHGRGPSARDTWIRSILQRRSAKKLSFITGYAGTGVPVAAFAFSPSFKILESTPYNLWAFE